MDVEEFFERPLTGPFDDFRLMGPIFSNIHTCRLEIIYSDRIPQATLLISRFYTNASSTMISVGITLRWRCGCCALG